MYKLLLDKKVVKYLKRLSESDYYAIKSKILTLADNPRPPGCKKLKGRNAYRILQGNFRIIYEIQDKQLMVYIVTVRNRKDVYRK